MSGSEAENLFKWIEENTLSPKWMSIDGINYDEAYIKVFHTSKSIDEFKEKYLELQKTYLVDFSKNINEPQETLEKDKEKSFKPIQAESKNKETYKDDDKMNELLRKLLENKFNKSDELEILFSMKFSYEAEEFNKQKVDIRI